MDAIQRAAWQSVSEPVTLPVRGPFCWQREHLPTPLAPHPPLHPKPLSSVIVTARASFDGALQGTLMHNPFISESPLSKESK